MLGKVPSVAAPWPSASPCCKASRFRLDVVVSRNVLGPDAPLLNYMSHPSQEGLHVLRSGVVARVVACLLGRGGIQEHCGGMSLLSTYQDRGREAINSRDAIVFLAISVTPPSSPSMDDRQGFQKRVSQRITAPERKRQ
jgi:hypothetical protein